MEIKILGTRTEIALLEEAIEKMGIFEEKNSSRVWEQGTYEKFFYKRIEYALVSEPYTSKEKLRNEFKEEIKEKERRKKQENKNGDGFLNIPDGIDEELPFD